MLYVRLNQTARNVRRKVARSKKVAVLPGIVGTSLDRGREIDAPAKLPASEQKSLAEAAKRGENVSAITALSACDPDKPSQRNEPDRAPTSDPRAWSMATPQKREAFVKAVGRSEIEDVFSAIDPTYAFMRRHALMHAWIAASPPERLAFSREYHDVIKTLGWQQKWQ